MKIVTASVLVLLMATSSLAFQNDATQPPRAVAGEGACVSSQFVYQLEGRPTPQCHASTIVESSGGLVAAWFGGSHEKNDDVGIWISRQGKRGWSKPERIATGSENEERDFPCWNPVLFQPQTGPLMLFYKVGPSPSQWWGVAMMSDDGGKTWKGRHKLGVDEKLGDKNPNLIGPVKNKPIQLKDGTIVCPSSSEHKGWRVHFERSRDGGKSWEVIGPINDASKFDAIQPSILTYGEQRLQILCRSRQGAVVTSWSDDGGDTWSAMKPTQLPNPNAGTDAVTLKDGRQLLVFNPIKRGRRVLHVALSKDGKNWASAITLEDDSNRAEYSYPAVIQTDDGMVHITYTWRRQTVKHVVLDPSKL